MRIFVSLIYCVCCVQFLLAQNLVRNPDFETGDLSAWNKWGNGITGLENEVYAGNFSGFLIAGTKGSLQQDIVLKPFTPYRLSVWAKVAKEGEKVMLIVNDGSNKTQEVKTTSFGLHSIDFTTGNSTEPVMISLYKHNESYGKVICDNFELIETGDVVNDILLTLNSTRIAVGNSYKLNAVAIPVTATDKDITISIDNISGAATLDENNILYPTKEGLININAVCNSNTAVTKTISIYITNKVESFFVDSGIGDDDNNGTSPMTPWKTLEKVNNYDFLPGDSILFKSSESWAGQLEINTTGTIDSFIVFSKYGSGNKPIINGNAGELYTIYILNSAYTRVTDFELTNTGISEMGGRYGIIMEANNAGDINKTQLLNIDIHDVNGHKEKGKGGGGGILWKIGGDLKSRFVNALIQGCHIYDCQRNGMNGKSEYGTSYYSLGMRIRENLIERIPGDGIVILGCDSAIVEYNICRDFTDDLPIVPKNAAAGIWPWSSKNTIIQYNEVSGHKAYWDGQGFDSDYNCENTIIQYNYSHDNGGGFILICSNGNYLAEGEKSSNYNTIVRYNISVNDGYRNWGTNGKYFCPTFHLAGPIYNTQIYNNTFYVAPKPDANIERTFVEATEWGGPWPDKTFFFNNIFYATEPTDFIMAQSKNNVFSHNLMFGSINHPADENVVNENPLFINPGESTDHNDYQLMANSPAIAAGRLINDNGGLDFFGNQVSASEAPNIGADNGKNTTDISQIKKEEKEMIRLYPNITDSRICLNVSESIKKGKITISSLTGQLMEERNFNFLNNGSTHFDVSHYRGGMYIVSLMVGNKKYSKRFIKQ